MRSKYSESSGGGFMAATAPFNTDPAIVEAPTKRFEAGAFFFGHQQGAGWLPFQKPDVTLGLAFGHHRGGCHLFKLYLFDPSKSNGGMSTHAARPEEGLFGNLLKQEELRFGQLERDERTELRWFRWTKRRFEDLHHG